MTQVAETLRYSERKMLEDARAAKNEELVIILERLGRVREHNKKLETALIEMDEAVCHGQPETAKRIARQAYEGCKR